MSETINFGIDLGTTNSAIAKYSEGNVEVFKNPMNLKQTLPSVVAFRKNRIVIGDKARELVQKDPANVVGTFKRKMGTADKYHIQSTGEKYSAEALSAFVLKELKNFIHTDEKLDAAVITIPASFDTMQSNATKKAGYEAGFQQVVLLQEPIAASLAYANKTAADLNDLKWLVYDLGGGTFDVALVEIEDNEMKITDHEGNNYLGGTDFDKAIVEKLIIPQLEMEGTFANLNQEMKSSSGKYNRLYNLLLFKAEEAKIALTNMPQAEIEFETEDDTGEELDIYMTITVQQFNEIIQPYIDGTVDMIQQMLMRNNLSGDDIEFVLMVGGSTYIPAVRQTLNDKLGINVNCDIDPTSCVATGAAYFAGMKLKDTQGAASQAADLVESKFEIKTAFSKVEQEAETAFIANIDGELDGHFYRITRNDGGYDSGLKPLQKNIVEYLPLVSGVFNAFTFKVFDEFNNVVPTNVPPIGITQGKYSIDGQPLPNDICLEVDAIEQETTFLELIFKKNTILPAKKTIVKQVSKNILRGSDDELVINIVEGHVESLASANKTIGFVKFSGKDLERDLIKGSDVEMVFEISESRDLKVEVYLTMTGQEYENVFNPSETHVSLPEVRRELGDFRKNIDRKIKEAEIKEEYESAAQLSATISDIDALEKRIDALKEDDVTDEKYQIDEAKRQIARQIHRFYNNTVLNKKIEKYFETKGNVFSAILYGDALPEEKQRYEDLIKDEKTFLQSANVSIIDMKITQLRGIISKMNARYQMTNEDVIAHFDYLKRHNFVSRDKAQELFKKGDIALSKNNFGGLLSVVNDLYRLKQSDENNDPNMFKKSGTGLK